MANSIEVPKDTKVNGARTTLAEKVVSYVIDNTIARAQGNGKLVYVDFQIEDVAHKVGASRKHVMSVFEQKLSHVMEDGADGNGWGIITGTLDEFLREVQKPPLPSVVLSGRPGVTPHHILGNPNKVHARGHGPNRSE